MKELVELHGGSVSADSPGTGSGSTFTVILPGQAQMKAAERLPGRVTKGAAMSGLAGVRILIVEDDPDALEIVMQTVTEVGASVMHRGLVAWRR